MLVHVSYLYMCYMECLRVLDVMGRVYGVCGVCREQNVACFVCVCAVAMGSMFSVCTWVV